MSLQEFKDYVTDSGVNFDELDNAGKLTAREQFDRSRGKLVIYSNYQFHTFVYV
jgi:hypothetical protein